MTIPEERLRELELFHSPRLEEMKELVRGYRLNQQFWPAAASAPEPSPALSPDVAGLVEELDALEAPPLVPGSLVKRVVAALRQAAARQDSLQAAYALVTEQLAFEQKRLGEAERFVSGARVAIKNPETFAVDNLRTLERLIEAYDRAIGKDTRP